MIVNEGFRRDEKRALRMVLGDYGAVVANSEAVLFGLSRPPNWHFLEFLQTNNKQVKPYIYLAGAAVCACVLSNCASGPRYQEIKPHLVPKPGKGLVIVYYPFRGVSAWKTISVYANHHSLTNQLQVGGFFVFQVGPGPLSISVCHEMEGSSQTVNLGQLAAVSRVYSEHHKFDLSVAVDVQAGETYFAEVSREKSHFLIIQQPQTEAEKGILGCHWIKTR